MAFKPTTEQQKEYTARWMAKLKADPVRYEAYRERARWLDRNRPHRKKYKETRGVLILSRVAASGVVHAPKPKSNVGKPRNRPETTTTKVNREVYHLTQAGEKITQERVITLRKRRKRNWSDPFNKELDDAINHLLGQGTGSGAGGGGGGGAC